MMSSNWYTRYDEDWQIMFAQWAVRWGRKIYPQHEWLRLDPQYSEYWVRDVIVIKIRNAIIRRHARYDHASICKHGLLIVFSLDNAIWLWSKPPRKRPEILKRIYQKAIPEMRLIAPGVRFPEFSGFYVV